jgi:holo-[acyl-carrier protein] synthase
MALTVGTDIIEIERIARALRRWPRFGKRVFTEREQAYCQARVNAVPSFAARFAAKEAVAKAIGTGFLGFAWQDVEIVNDEQGRPEIVLSGRAAALARERRLGPWTVSLSHTRVFALAVVVAAGDWEE